MLIYVILFLFVAQFAIFENKFTFKEKNLYTKIILCVLFFFAAFRYKVGSDWFQYEEHYVIIGELGINSFYEFDFGWSVVNLVSNYFGMGVLGVNIITSFIFFVSLNQLVKITRSKFVTICVCLPYVYTIVLMGYVRQAIALSFFMFGTYFIVRNKILYGLLITAIGVLFHSSAIFMVACIAVYFSLKSFSLKNFFIVVFLVGMLFYFSWDELNRVDNYIDYEISASGAVPRALISFVFSLILLIMFFRGNFSSNYFFVFLSFCCILFFPLAFFQPVLADRLFVYFVLVQLYFCGNIGEIIFGPGYDGSSIYVIPVLLYGFYYCVWLMYGTNAASWVPYGNSVFNFIIDYVNL